MTAVPAITTSPGSAVRVATVPLNGATTRRSLRLARASSSCARARSAPACAAAMSACAWRICPCTATTWRARLGLPDSGGRLVLTRAHLLVIEHGDHLTRLDAIAFPHGDLADPPGGLGGDGGVIALDPSAHRDHAWRNGGRSKEETPNGKH